MKRLMEKVGRALLNAAAGAPPEPGPEPSTKAAGACDRGAFNTGVRRMLEGRKEPVQVGAIHLIGMADIQHALGPEAWPVVAARAYQMTEHVVLKHLGPKDFFGRHDDENYVLCFADLDHAEASSRIQTIVDEVKTELVELTPETSAIRIGHEVVEVEAEVLKREHGSLMDAIASTLEDIKKEADAAQKHDQRALLEQARIVYAPVCNLRKKRVSLYRCVLDDLTSRTIVSKLVSLSEEGDAQQVLTDLDSVILGRAVPDLHRVLQTGHRIILIIPVSYTSLSRKSSREAYLALCHRLPSSYRKFIMFELYGIPPHAPKQRVAELLIMLRPYCGATIVEATSHRLTMDSLVAKGLYAVAVDFDAVQPGLDLRQLVKTSAACGLRVLIYGARTMGTVAAAYKLGVDFVSGEAVAAKLRQPRPAYPLNPMPDRPRDNGC